jgi:hypothetical protein
MEKFYATSIFYAYLIERYDGFPVYLFKIASKESGSAITCHEPMGNGPMLSVGKNLILFDPKNDSGSLERRVELVSNRYWIARTPSIVALFYDSSKIEEWMESENPQPCDPRWQVDTDTVLHMIGEKHKYFSVCHDPNMALV